MASERKMIFLHTEKLKPAIEKALIEGGYLPVMVADTSKPRLLSAELSMISADATPPACMDALKEHADKNPQSHVFANIIKNLAKYSQAIKDTEPIAAAPKKEGQ